MGSRLLVPEVVQTSAMDCGPACLKSLLEGHGIGVSYERLREACLTDLDGTSINTIEQVANSFGLAAEQIMVPADHLFRPEANLLPSLVVVRLPNTLSHFVITWRRVGGYVQVMDPAHGRRWLKPQTFLDQILIHSQGVDATEWREWAGSDDFIQVLRGRAKAIGLSPAAVDRFVGTALADPTWRSLAILDAGIRMLVPIAASCKTQRRRTVEGVLERLFDEAAHQAQNAFSLIPPAYWSVLPVKRESAENRLVFRGAVLLRVGGTQQQRVSPAAPDRTEIGACESPEQLRRRPVQPIPQLLRMLREDGLLAPGAVLIALIIAAGGITFEALLYRTFLDLAGVLGLPEQRLGAVAMLAGFAAVLLLLSLLSTTELLRIGRNLEIRMRTLLLRTLPQLPDRYFSSRPVSDMADRSHLIHQIRGYPSLGSMLVSYSFELILTTAGIIWLDPASAAVAVSFAVLAIAIPFAVQPILTERDLRVRTHSGGLCRFYFDSLCGLIPIRTHGAEPAVRAEHEGLVVKWVEAGMALRRGTVILEGVRLSISLGMTSWLLMDHIGRSPESTVGLLMVYWTLSLPVIGRELAETIWQYPQQHNIAQRLLEPLAAATPEAGPTPIPAPVDSRVTGVHIRFADVSVRALGQTILEGINLTVEPGSHVCIVGRSGAGKSTLAGLLLGWHSPADGAVFIDGENLSGSQLDRLRLETAWVDPSVQLWNRSLFENLAYGDSTEKGTSRIGDIVREADLLSVLEALPDGLQSNLGESGRLLSGGEAQRVRLGRAMVRSSARLVILDEPFTALDRARREEMLSRLRRYWADATLLCITHDVSESRCFDRVVVLEGGRIIEDGRPSELVARSDSRLRQMLAADEAVRKQLLSNRVWRRLWLEDGAVRETNEYDEHRERFINEVLARGGAQRSFGSAGAKIGSAPETGGITAAS